MEYIIFLYLNKKTLKKVKNINILTIYREKKREVSNFAALTRFDYAGSTFRKL